MNQKHSANTVVWLIDRSFASFEDVDKKNQPKVFLFLFFFAWIGFKNIFRQDGCSKSLVPMKVDWHTLFYYA